ncbi:unnamed protein product [Vitrella brassicaformis CCMP3155]|uniref:Uncharacterized protein n=1 Tax=Vitrella brassicaformis (strain CCMP3155) TaxID=1169540 RepID=A0A0G4E950_VITBC|nr:unnamed protein product [Vitrella brassicaformis CCMP3155]|eukprot:CEL92446.1 unnamed protein product [Vitrella brassicaformis CCMP3155]
MPSAAHAPIAMRPPVLPSMPPLAPSLPSLPPFAPFYRPPRPALPPQPMRAQPIPQWAPTASGHGEGRATSSARGKERARCSYCCLHFVFVDIVERERWQREPQHLRDESVEIAACEAAIDAALASSPLCRPAASSDTPLAAPAAAPAAARCESDQVETPLRAELEQLKAEYERVQQSAALFEDNYSTISEFWAEAQQELDAARQRVAQLQEQLKDAQQGWQKAERAREALMFWHRPGRRWGWMPRTYWEDEDDDEDDSRSDVTEVGISELQQEIDRLLRERNALVKQSQQREVDSMQQQQQPHEMLDDASDITVVAVGAGAKLEDEKASLAREVEFLQGEYNAQSDFLMLLKSSLDRMMLQINELQQDKDGMSEELAEMETHSAPVCNIADVEVRFDLVAPTQEGDHAPGTHREDVL